MSTETINAISSKTMRVIEHIGASVLIGIGGYIVGFVIGINPIAGFAYSATTVLIGKVTEPLFKDVFFRDSSNADSKRLGRFLWATTSNCSGFVATNLFVATLTTIHAFALAILLTASIWGHNRNN